MQSISSFLYDGLESIKTSFFVISNLLGIGRVSKELSLGFNNILSFENYFYLKEDEINENIIYEMIKFIIKSIDSLENILENLASKIGFLGFSIVLFSIKEIKSGLDKIETNLEKGLIKFAFYSAKKIV